jgi:recombination protein RecT
MTDSALTLRENPKMTEFRDLLHRYRDRFAKVASANLSADSLLQLGLTAMGRNAELQACTPQSILRALMVANQLGLDPTGVLGQGYLIPYKRTATFIPGYKGLMDLARRTGIVVGIEAHVVYDHEQFEMSYGIVPVLVHKPVYRGASDAAKAVGAYGIIRLRGDAVPLIEWMSKEDIERIRKRSRAGDSGPWVTDWPQMARKTVLRRVLNYAPVSRETRIAMAVEDRFEDEGEAADVSDLLPMPDLSDASAPPPVSKAEEMMGRIRRAAGVPEGQPEGGGPAAPNSDDQTDLLDPNRPSSRGDAP